MLLFFGAAPVCADLIGKDQTPEQLKSANDIKAKYYKDIPGDERPAVSPSEKDQPANVEGAASAADVTLPQPSEPSPYALPASLLIAVLGVGLLVYAWRRVPRG